MSKICPRCKTENEDAYSFCKNCGTSLGGTYTDNGFNNNYAQQNYSYNAPVESINDIPIKDVYTFVGKNSEKIVNKFSRMEITNSKIAWNWPVAVLSFFFGFFGAAIWYFYRKMYKAALIALAVGCVFIGVKTAITYDTVQSVVNDFANGTYNYQDNNFNLEKYLDEIQGKIEDASNSPDMRLSSLIDDAERFLSTVLLGMFSMYFYKKHTVEKINKYREHNGNNTYYDYGLSVTGGTSAGMAVLGVVICIILTNTVSTLPIINSFTNIF